MELPQDWSQHAHSLLDYPDEGENWLEYHDKALTHYRAARIIGNRLDSCIFIYSQNLLPPRDWLISLFQKDSISADERANLLRGTPPQEQEDCGRIVCACFNVGEKTIRQAILQHGLQSVEMIGDKVQAGTNCGSCKPELADLLGDQVG